MVDGSDPEANALGPRMPMKITFFGHFGSSNTGNESTLLAVHSRLRVLAPDSEFSCICSHPEVVAAREGIEALPINARVLRLWKHEEVMRWDRRLGGAFVGLKEELREYVRAFRSLEGTDMLIVSGTGLVTDAYCIAGWGPYNQFKWALMARLRGCKVVFLSVGVGPVHRLRGRILVRASLRLADYRSYRDDASLEYLRRMHFRAKRDRVYPDLVFGLPEALLPPERNGDGQRRRIVGLGLMDYVGRYNVPDPGFETQKRYLQSLGAFVEWLLAHDYDVRLLLGDGDRDVVDDLKSVLRERLGSFDESRVVDEPIESVRDVLSQIAATDVVVATRFHNVLLAMVLGKPVIAITFHHKCDALMNQMGLSEYRHDLNHMDANALIDQFQALERNREDVTRTLEQGVQVARKALDEQYDLLLATL
jgi:polysaccharide pyruvyl transferase WcaK-like protein